MFPNKDNTTGQILKHLIGTTARDVNLWGIGKDESGRGGIKKADERVGDDLLSQGAAPPVPSAQVGLTTGFEKGPGVPPPPKSPTPPSGVNYGLWFR